MCLMNLLVTPRWFQRHHILILKWSKWYLCMSTYDGGDWFWSLIGISWCGTCVKKSVSFKVLVNFIWRQYIHMTPWIQRLYICDHINHFEYYILARLKWFLLCRKRFTISVISPHSLVTIRTCIFCLKQLMVNPALNTVIKDISMPKYHA